MRQHVSLQKDDEANAAAYEAAKGAVVGAAKVIPLHLPFLQIAHNPNATRHLADEHEYCIDGSGVPQQPFSALLATYSHPSTAA